MDELLARMADLEVRQAFQDDSLQTLSDIVVQQQKQIDSLVRELERLKARQEEQALEFNEVPVERPPHY